MNIKRIVIIILVAALGIFGMRRYTINWAVESMEFGCLEAAQMEYRNFSMINGIELFKFCGKRNEQVKEEWSW